MWSWSSAAFCAFSWSSSSVVRLMFRLSAQDMIASKRWMMKLSRRFAWSRSSRLPVLRAAAAGTAPRAPPRRPARRRARRRGARGGGGSGPGRSSGSPRGAPAPRQRPRRLAAEKRADARLDRRLVARQRRAGARGAGGGGHRGMGGREARAGGQRRRAAAARAASSARSACSGSASGSGDGDAGGQRREPEIGGAVERARREGVDHRRQAQALAGEVGDVHHLAPRPDLEAPPVRRRRRPAPARSRSPAARRGRGRARRRSAASPRRRRRPPPAWPPASRRLAQSCQRLPTVSSGSIRSSGRIMRRYP